MSEALDDNPFLKGLPNLTVEENKYAEVMRGVGELSMQFATAMMHAQMPVDTITSDVRVDKGDKIVSTRVLTPYWAVLDVTNLTGSKLISGSIHKHTSSYMGGAYGTHTEIANKSDARLKLSYDDAVSYYEKQFGVTPQGMFIALRKILNARWDIVNGQESHFTTFDPDFYQFDITDSINPADLFALDTGMSAQKLIKEMQKRMKLAQKKYTDKLFAERGKGPITRDLSYYTVHEETQTYPGHKPSKTKKRRGLFR